MKASSPVLVGTIIFSVSLACAYFVKKIKRERARRYSLLKLRNPIDYEKHALEFGNPLGAIYFGYRSGLGETMANTRSSFEKLKFVPRSMKGVDSSCETSYFGKKVSAPLIVAPTALHTLADPEGEVATARGTGQAGCTYCFNYFLSSQPIEKVAQQPGEKWLHLYLFVERELVEFALEDALEKHKGVFSAVIVTIE